MYAHVNADTRPPKPAIRKLMRPAATHAANATRMRCR
ncbi:Uncharacterised protein [Mycobacteroides abscessus subsp. abscessus]|nr:Uncharacterised protein [Mycobacteroides abscessus subsp. abscessus]